VISEFKVCRRSDLDAGEAENGRRNVPMDFAMEMAKAATSCAGETPAATKFELME
jgi:hypothetical protein